MTTHTSQQITATYISQHPQQLTSQQLTYHISQVKLHPVFRGSHRTSNLQPSYCVFGHHTLSLGANSIAHPNRHLWSPLVIPHIRSPIYWWHVVKRGEHGHTPGKRRLVLLTLVFGTQVGKLYSASTLVLSSSASCSWDGSTLQPRGVRFNSTHISMAVGPWYVVPQLHSKRWWISSVVGGRVVNL